MMSINQCTKMEAGVIHFLPFKPTVMRKQGFQVDRTYGKKTMTLHSPELLNIVDMMVFTQMVNDYNRDPSLWNEDGQVDGKRVVKRTLDLGVMTKERIGNTDKNNRRVTAQCFKRMSNIKVIIKSKSSTTYTWYIHQITITNDFKSIEVVVNETFLQKCLNNGLVFNYGRLLTYGKKYYAVLLDAYLQGTKNSSKNGYSWRKTYKQNRLFEVLFFNSTNMRDLDKHQIVKESFHILKTIGNLPDYTYEKFSDKWMRTDYLKQLSYVS